MRNVAIRLSMKVSICEMSIGSSCGSSLGISNGISPGNVPPPRRIVRVGQLVRATDDAPEAAEAGHDGRILDCVQPVPDLDDLRRKAPRDDNGKLVGDLLWRDPDLSRASDLSSATGIVGSGHLSWIGHGVLLCLRSGWTAIVNLASGAVNELDVDSPAVERGGGPSDDVPWAIQEGATNQAPVATRGGR